MLALYVLNFLGSAVSRFATGLAPVVAALALASAAWLLWTSRAIPAARTWAGWILFATGAGLLTAMGRADAFGSDQAFVSRYISFSSTFWLGWFGLVAVVMQTRVRARPQWLVPFASAVVVIGIANGLHLVKQARATGTEASETSARIRAQWPRVDDEVLREIYFDRPDIARERLERLHALDFAPFE